MRQLRYPSQRLIRRKAEMKAAVEHWNTDVKYSEKMRRKLGETYGNEKCLEAHLTQALQNYD